jgi:hypothetical protein
MGMSEAEPTEGPSPWTAAACVRVVLALVLGAATTGTASAAPAACGRLAPIEAARAELTVAPAQPPRLVAASEAVIQRRAEETGAHREPGGAVVRGLTATRLEAHAGHTLAQAKLPDGTVCIALRAVQAKLANSEVTIYVDRRYPPQSCERRAVLDHERLHVRIAEAALHDGEAPLRKRLKKVAARWSSRWVLGAEAKRIEIELRDVIEQAVQGIRAAADREHARLDSPESYARTQQRCAGW